MINLITRLFARFRSSPDTVPTLVPIREIPKSAVAVVFLHGFGGSSSTTWGQFPAFLESRPELNGWDIYSLGYASSLRLDVPRAWSADPSLSLLSVSLRTALSVAPLVRYRSIALIAHSMGGLVAQHALLDPTAASRIGHLVLFGTPSGGLRKAVLVGFLKRQLHDMEEGSAFISDLRRRWNERYSTHCPFELRVVAGERDEFVPATSSLAPFPATFQRVVPGDHLAIVKPETASDRNVQLVLETLCRTGTAVGLVDSARLAVERRDFSDAVTILRPRAKEIDDGALVQLALALESLGRVDEALGVLEERFEARGQPSTDAYGVLAGRLKRRWLVERRESDWRQARALYEKGLTISAPPATGCPDSGQAVNIDADQAMYHAINVAFLDLMWTPPASGVPSKVREMAALADNFAQQAAGNHWRAATLGDAKAMLGDLDAACNCYSDARRLASKPRDVQSMYSQALRVVEHIYGTRGVGAVEQAFAIISAT